MDELKNGQKSFLIKQFLLRICIVLFMTSVSVTVISYEMVCTYGLLGEVTCSTVISEKSLFEELQKNVSAVKYPIKSNVYNIWFNISSIIIYLVFVAYMLRLPRKDTIVTLKVRMDD